MGSEPWPETSQGHGSTGGPGVLGTQDWPSPAVSACSPLLTPGRWRWDLFSETSVADDFLGWLRLAGPLHSRPPVVTPRPGDPPWLPESVLSLFLSLRDPWVAEGLHVEAPPLSWSTVLGGLSSACGSGGLALSLSNRGHYGLRASVFSPGPQFPPLTIGTMTCPPRGLV